MLIIIYFILVTIVATAMKSPGKTVPPVSDAIILVGIFFVLVYGVSKLIKRAFRKSV